MNDSPAVVLESARPEPALLPPQLRLLLRLEGLAVAVITAILYARTGASWWLFAALWLLPDLSMLGYLGRPCRAARIYNSAHTYAVPGTLAACALLVGASNLLPFALIWANHIAVDRLLGFGLKYSEGFVWTHLGRAERSVGARLLGRRAGSISDQ